MMSQSREQMLKRLNKYADYLDNMPGNAVETMADTGELPNGYEIKEAIRRLAMEVRYRRLHDKLYGG